jgi:hypothetical protein
MTDLSTDMHDAVSYVFAMVQAWIHQFCSLASSIANQAKRGFLLVVSAIHRACGFFINPPRVNWVTLFAFTPDPENLEDVTIVVRVVTAFGFNERAQGCVALQRYGMDSSLFRLLIDGHLPPPELDNDGGSVERVKGVPIVGAVYFPDSVLWTTVHKKVKSHNNTAIRGRSTLIYFPANITGIQSVQVSFIHGTPKGKEISASFQAAIDMSTMAANSLHNSGGGSHTH